MIFNKSTYRILQQALELHLDNIAGKKYNLLLCTENIAISEIILVSFDKHIVTKGNFGNPI